MAATLAEKILARAAGRESVSPGEFVTARIDAAMVHDIFTVGVFRHLAEAGIERVFDPERVHIVIDHMVPPPTEAAAEAHRRMRELVERFGITHFYEAGEGISHQLLAERGHALPGSLIVATDSHTTTLGALAAAATGIGSTEAAYVLAAGSLWFRVPETIRFDLTGALHPMVTGKDVILAIAGRYGADVAQYRSVEYAGPSAPGIGVYDRLTICNMGVEIGAKFSFFPADGTALAYLAERGVDGVEPFGPDPDAAYAAVHEVSLAELEPQVACPHAVDNVAPVGEVEGVSIDQAFIGTCTNGRLEDLEAAAAVLRGRQVHPRVRLLVSPASRAVQQAAARSGALQALIEAGASILAPGCGPCFGGHGGLLAPGERCIGTLNRNFPGRMGSTKAEIYLASPQTVAASAVAGCIADPRKLD